MPQSLGRSPPTTSSSFIANSFERQIHNFIMPQPIAHSLFYFLCKFRINTNTDTNTNKNPSTNCFPFLRVNEQNERNGPSRHRQRLGQIMSEPKKKRSEFLCKTTGKGQPDQNRTNHQQQPQNEKLEGRTRTRTENCTNIFISKIVYFKFFAHLLFCLILHTSRRVGEFLFIYLCFFFF